MAQAEGAPRLRQSVVKPRPAWRDASEDEQVEEEGPDDDDDEEDGLEDPAWDPASATPAMNTRRRSRTSAAARSNSLPLHLLVRVQVALCRYMLSQRRN